jgi:hypothetical protein
MADDDLFFKMRDTDRLTQRLLSALSSEFIDLRSPEGRQYDLQRWLGQVECLGGHLWGLQWLVDDPVSCVRCGAAV